MPTRSSSNLIVESSTIPKRHNRRRSKQIVEPELLSIVETPVATMADTRTMSELLQAPTEGYEDAIVIPAILAENFELKVRLLQLVTSSQFHGFERDDPHAHIRWFNKITSTLKYKNVPYNAIKLMLFLFSLEGAAQIWLEKEPSRSILTWEDLISKFVNYFPPSKTTNLKNDITNFQQKFDETFSEAWDRFKDLLRKCPHHGFSELHQIDTFYNVLTQSDQESLYATAGGNILNRTPRDALTIIENKSKVRTSRNKPIVSKVSTTTSSSPSPDITALTNIVKELVLMNKANQQASVKAVEETCVTCGGPHPYYECLATDSNTFNAYASTGTYNQGGNGYRPQGDPNYRASNQMGPPGFPPSNSRLLHSRLPKEVERETKATKDKVQTTSSESIAHVQPLVVQDPIPEPEVAPKPKPKLSIPYPSRLNDQKLQEKANYQMLKFLQIFQKLHFDLSFADALLHIHKFASTFKTLLSNKEKLFELANTPLNENCSSLVECLALVDLSASINLMPLSVWKKLSLPELTPTRMTLELANVDYDVDPRVPLILGRPFLRTTRALIDLHGEELILRDGNEQLIFHTDTTSKDPNEHRIESAKMINFIDVSCEDNFKEVLKIKKIDHDLSGSTTFTPNSSPSLTPVETKDSLLEEFADELALLDPFPPRIGDADFNAEGDILLLEKLLNDDPSSPLPSKELNFKELKMIKSLIDDFPPLDILGGNFMTFSIPLFDANDDFTSSDDESLPEEDVQEDNFKIYSNPLFEFDEEYISSDVNPIFNEVLEHIESEHSYVSNLNEPVLSVTPLSDANEDECFDPGGDIDEIDAFLDIDVEDGYHDSEGDIIYFENLLNNDTISNLPPDVFLDHDPRSLKDELDNNDLKSMVKVFDPGISAYSFYSLEPVAYGSPMEICSSTCFDPNITMIWGEIAPDYEDSRACGFVHRPLELQSLACLFMGIRYPRSY
ncbi:reverse transcriptase domain-containing protein [Tanacetum coccineum]|uniref:Reverse transcriptase domain-containing protein n=1 Tax=Tanacetum coccineum TaxID=301880 RepID=A0ABQ5G7L6_9ASTR